MVSFQSILVGLTTQLVCLYLKNQIYWLYGSSSGINKEGEMYTFLTSEYFLASNSMSLIFKKHT